MAEAQAAAVDPKAAPVAGAEPEKKPEAEVVEKPAPRTYSQEDLDRITAKVKKNERYRTRKEVEAFYQGRESIGKPREEPAKPAEDKEPTRADFADYESYLEAKAAHVGRKVAREERQKLDAEEKTRTATERRQKAITSFQTKVREKYPDIEERLEAISAIVMPAGMDEAITESDLGPDILDWLSRNPKDCERIASLAPSAAIREIGKLEARLEGQKPAADATPAGDKPAEGNAKTPSATNKPSAAPAPIKPGGSGGSPSDDQPRDTDSTADWIRKERARMRKLAS